MNNKPLGQFDEHGMFVLEDEMLNDVVGGVGDRIVTLVKDVVFGDPQGNHICMPNGICNKNIPC